MTTYCPHCGAENTYAITKPTECQKCDKPFAGAFKPTATHDETPTKRATPVKKKRSAALERAVAKRHEQEDGQRQTRSKLLNVPADVDLSQYGLDDDGGETDDDADDDGDEYVDRDDVSILADEIRASFDERQIFVQGLEQTKVHFRDWVKLTPKSPNESK